MEIHIAVQAECSARFVSSAPRFWPTIVAAACPRPIAGMMAIEMILFPIPNALTTAVPKRARMPVMMENPSAVPDWPSDAGAPITRMFLTVAHSRRR